MTHVIDTAITTTSGAIILKISRAGTPSNLKKNKNQNRQSTTCTCIRYQIALTSQCRQQIKTAEHQVVTCYNLLDLLVPHNYCSHYSACNRAAIITFASTLLRYCSTKATYIIDRGYYMATRRYKISLRVWKNISRVSAANE